MSYQPTVWQAGDTITSARLNKLEQGVAAGGGAGGMVIHAAVDEQEHTITVTDATAGDVWDALTAGSSIVLIAEAASLGQVRSVCQMATYSEGDGYDFMLGGNMDLHASTAADYPVSVGN